MSFAACSAALLPQLLSSKCSNGTGAKLSTQAPRRCGALALHRKVHALTCSLSSESETGVSRRDALACGGLSAVLLAVKPDEAQAAYANRRGGGGGTIGEAGYDTFYGLARPPASYGFSARTEPKLARYSFSYPSNWEEEIIGKVEHGTGGIDSRVKGDGCKAFVVTVINEGMDTQSFDLSKQTPYQLLTSVSSGIQELQEALLDSDISSEKVTKNGKDFVNLTLEGQKSYKATFVAEEGRVFAFFVQGTKRNYSANQAAFTKMVDTFAVYPPPEDRA